MITKMGTNHEWLNSSHKKQHHQSPSQQNNAGNGNLMFGLTLLLPLAFLFFLACVCSCFRRRRGESAVSARTKVTATGGLTKEVIDSFPIMHYSEVKGFNLREGTLECAICISEFEDNEALRLLPSCNHAFHPECIDRWLDSRITCPVCRADLTSSHVAEAELPVRHVVPPAEIAEPSVSLEEERRWSAAESERFTLRLPENLLSEMVSRSIGRSTSAPCSDPGQGKRKWQSLDMSKLNVVSFPRRTRSLQPSRRAREGGGLDEGGSSTFGGDPYRRL